MPTFKGIHVDIVAEASIVAQ